MTTDINVMHWGMDCMDDAQDARVWRHLFERMRYEATKPRKLPVRGLSRVAAVLACAAAMLMLSLPYMAPRQFSLSESQGTITPSDHQPLHAAGDWLTRHKYAVLTFDDGPEGSALDDRILRVLRHHHARALFFVVCSKMNAETARSITKMESEGHAIGNHSYDHLKLSSIASSALPHQIEDCSQRIAQVTGHRPRYFRPPFGMTSDQVRHVAEQAGMKQMLWDANSYDCLVKNPTEIVRRATNETFDASIILMHEKATTAAALDQILTNLEQRGFQFVLPDDASAAVPA
ncbi:polysaccharide deacetylase family protein [Dyella sp. ASV21]|uniref:polysaccharide deacetylase family protein n=1 Tax=Dyella sp. ASV21 TaxID=2795114 RepID=UPI0018EDC9A4|nr:polysaccharide deacetylase family protein [Dyella sp. ASV21]